MHVPVRALRKILIERRAIAHKEQQVLSRMLDAIAQQASNGTPPRQPAQRAGGRKRLSCPRCHRRFALPMHLGRHLATSHKRRRKAA